MNLDLIRQDFPFLSENQITTLSDFLNFVLEKNKEFNLTAIKDYEVGLIKHIYDCLLPLKEIDLKGKLILDIGSGAGFPGLVWAIAVPEATLYLSDSTGKRVNFLNEAIAKFGLTNVTAHKVRAEELKLKEHFDLVSARAVAATNILLEMAAPLLKVGGLFLDMKGKDGKEEVAKSSHALKVLGMSVVSTSEHELPLEMGYRYLALIKKDKPTHKKYPREYKEILASPL